MVNDFLQDSQFTLSFDKLPNATLRLQNCSIPSLGLSHSEIGTPFSWLKEPDTKLNFSEFPITFKLDENFDGYLEVFNWMMGLSFPESFDQYAELKGPEQYGRTRIFSDATLTVLTNKNNPNLRVTFRDLFPTFLSQVDFQTTNEDVMNIDVAASFEYHLFKVEKLA